MMNIVLLLKFRTTTNERWNVAVERCEQYVITIFILFILIVFPSVLLFLLLGRSTDAVSSKLSARLSRLTYAKINK